MPTYGWILEKASDAFFERQPKLHSNAPPTPAYKCPFCNSLLGTTGALDQHVVSEHSVPRPFVLIDGREPSRHVVRRTTISASNVYVANATNVTMRVNDKPAKQVPPSRVAGILSTMRCEDVSLTLSNSSKKNVPEVSETYSLSFRVATPEALHRVEGAFREFLAASNLSLGSIQSFIDDARCIGEGADYAKALAEYAMGILRKEDPKSEHLTTPSKLYRDDYIRAEEALREVGRPLARLVSQIARFALNDFSAEPVDTGYWELDLAYRLLRDPRCISLPRRPEPTQRKLQVCPVDHDTAMVLNLAARMSMQERWSPLLTNECSRALSGSLEAVDQAKVAAVWAACAWRLRAFRDASEPLRMIAATYPFERWAEPLLEELEQ